MSKDIPKKASSSLVEAFLSSEQEQQVVAAIIAAEKQTSGEIRVHLENFDPKLDNKMYLSEHAVELPIKEHVFQRAQHVFAALEMQNTKEHNGVLIYVAVNLRRFVVYGDHGIDQKVGHDFWNSTCGVISTYFKKQEFSKGLAMGIAEIGRVLSTYFPNQGVLDTNELDNQISKSDE